MEMEFITVQQCEREFEELPPHWRSIVAILAGKTVPVEVIKAAKGDNSLVSACCLIALLKELPPFVTHWNQNVMEGRGGLPLVAKLGGIEVAKRMIAEAAKITAAKQESTAGDHQG